MTEKDSQKEARDGVQHPPDRLVEYAIEALKQRLQTLLSQEEGVRESKDIEAVHDMRVASRRARAAFDVFENCFPARPYRQIKQEVKAVTGVLSEARDLDVMMDALSAMEKRLPAAQQPAVKTFRKRLRKQRKAAQKSVVRVLDKLDRDRVMARFQRMASQSVESNHREFVSEKQETHGKS